MTIDTKQRILVISPHPDDEAIGCGGLIMLAHAKKLPVHVLYMSVGSSRQFLTGKTSAKTRIPEIKKAAKFGSFTYTIAFRGKAFMRLDALPQKSLIEPIEDCIQSFKPTIVTFPHIDSYDQDHRASALATITALRPLPQGLRHQPSLVLSYAEPYDWDIKEGFHPNFYLDISLIMEEKILLLKKHLSQMRKDPFPRSPENLLRLSGFWGSQIGTKYAEAYKVVKQTVSI